MYCVHKKARTMHHKNGLLQKYCFDTNLLEDKNFFMNILPRGSSPHLVLDSITGSTLFSIYSITIVTFTSNCFKDVRTSITESPCILLYYTIFFIQIPREV